MNRRLPSILVMIVVVALAGCGGITSFADESPDNETPTPQPTATDSESESGTDAGSTMTGTGTDSGTTETGTKTESGKFEYSPGYSESGITNPERAIEQHISALRSHDSFTYTVKRPTTSPRTRIILTNQVDRDNKRQYTVLNGTIADKQSLHIEQYQIKNSKYSATSILSIDKIDYNVTKQPFTVPLLNTTKQDELFFNFSGSVRFGEAKRVTRDGETFVRYESTKLLNPEPFLPSSAPLQNGTVSEFNATILVDEEGIIRSFTYSATYTTSRGREVTVNSMVRVSDIGSTTVEKPEWLKEAKKQTNAS
jgi:uncharacterized protein YceK